MGALTRKPRCAQLSSKFNINEQGRKLDTSARIDELPYELKLAILEAIPDLPALNSLTRASPSFYTIYIGQRTRLLKEVLLKDMGDVLVDASLMRDSSYIRLPARVPQFLKRKQRNMRGEKQYQITDEKLDEITRFHLLIYALTYRFSNDALSIRPNISKDDARDDNLLSQQELLRFHRAFYRYETLCRILGGSGDLFMDQFSFGQWEKRILDQYLSILEPWEIEEILCVGFWIFEYYHRVIKRSVEYLKVEFCRGDRDINGRRYSQSIVENGKRISPVFPTVSNDVLVEENWYKEAAQRCARMGLDFLGRVMRGRTQDQSALLAPHIFIRHRGPRITPVYWKNVSFWMLGENPRLKWHSHGKVEEFRGEDKGPNAAFAWARRTWSLDSWEHLEDKNFLFGWAYVMWDLGRLEKWRVLKMSCSHLSKKLSGKV